MEEAASMKLKHSILGLLLLFTLVPLGIFGIFSIYETNRKIDELTEQNVQAISENQVMNIKNFTQDQMCIRDRLIHTVRLCPRHLSV